MLRVEPLESRDVPAIVVDLTIDLAAGRVFPEGGVLQVSEIVADGQREYVDPEVIERLTTGQYELGKPLSSIIKPLSLADANDSVRFSRDAFGNVVVESSEPLFARVQVLGTEVLAYLGHRFAVAAVSIIDVDLQLGGDDTVVNLAGMPASIKTGEGNDILVGGPEFEVLDGGSGSDLYLAVDRGPDVILNDHGDVFFGDPFDVRAI